MQNDMANDAVNLNGCSIQLHDTGMTVASRRKRVHRTWFFWSFLLIPVLVALGWSQYVSFISLPWLGIHDVQHTVRWNDWMRYYIWLQLVWLPANMVAFLIWCALGVRIWNFKRRVLVS